jgi:putative ABC transport system permease protein
MILILTAGIIGYLASVPFGDFFSASVIRYCGYGSSQWMKWVFPLVGVILLSLLVMLGCRRIIGRNLKSTVIELMRGEEKIRKEGHYSLPAGGLKNRNITIALGELRCKWKEYAVIFMVFVFSSFLILLPMNMKTTVENPSFMTYMGVGESDIRIDIQYSDDLSAQKETVVTYLSSDPDIEKYAMYRYGYVQYQNAEGLWEYLRVESGDESVFPLSYLEGKAPDEPMEMALSYLNASELGIKTGDTESQISG